MAKSQNRPLAEESADIEVAEKQIDPAVEKVSRALAAQIHTFRTSAGIASGTLAKMAGISHSMLSRIEKGTATPSIETLTRLANALGKPVSRFFVDQSDRAAQRTLRGGLWRLSSLNPASRQTDAR